MTNRERYIIKRNEYDLMMTIYENIAINACPIEVIGGNYIECENDGSFGSCKDCVQKWLNEEAFPFP